MFKTKITEENVNFIKNKVIINLPTNLTRLKIIDAVLNVKVKEITNAINGYSVNFSYYENDEIKNSWENVEFIKDIKSEQKLKINISDELQESINHNANKVELNFVSKTSEDDSVENSISFEKDEDNDLIEIDYISLSEYQENSTSHSIDLNDAGTLDINLLTGELSLSTLITNSDQNVLPLSIINNYSNTKRSEILGKNCLNLNQYLIQNNSEDGSLNFTYIDQDGKSQIINESYYYEVDGKKTPVKRSDLSVSVDGSLKTSGGKDVKTELVAPSGLKLVSSIEGLNGSNLVNYEPEELANINMQIKNLEESIFGAKLSIESARMQLCDILINLISKEKNDITKLISTQEIKNELNKYVSISQENNEQNTEKETKSFPIEIFPENYLEDFIKNFNGSKENELNQDIYNKTSLKLQVKPLCENIKEQLKNLNEFKSLQVKYEYQQKQYQLQVPVHYLYNENGVIYGFGKTETKVENTDIENIETTTEKTNSNIYRLVVIMDSYENAISINYESSDTFKIKSITNSANKTITFNYENENLISIIDSREREIKLEYDDVNIIKITRPNGETSRYFYENDKLVAAINSAGFGAKITYDGELVSRVDSLSILDYIKNDDHNFKLNLDEIKPNNQSEPKLIDLAPYLIDNKYVEFKHNNLRSTTIKNGNGKSLTYLFDKFGKIRTIYENEFSEDNEDFSPRVTSYEYQDNKVSLKTNTLPYSENYLSDVCFNNESVKNISALYFSEETYCSEETFPYSYQICDNIHTIPANEPNKCDEMTMSKENIIKLNSSNSTCTHKAFVVSGWAKANSAFIPENRDINNSRKFALKVEIEYADGKIKEFSNNFDWRNTDWQYCSTWVKLENKEVKSIKCYIDYSDNTGEIKYTDLEFKEADYELVNYNEFNLPNTLESGHSNYVTAYEYDKDNKLIKTVIKNKFDDSQTYETTYEYNKNGKLLRVVDYNGLVRENVYNDKGLIVKSLTYHKEEPSLKLYEETLLDDKGNTIGSINEFGEETSKYNYIDGTSIVSEKIDSDNSKTTYGYGSNDTLLQMSANVANFNNTNTYGYELGFLTKLTHNDFDISYDYDDSQGRVTEIKIAGERYLDKIYAEKEEITILANNEEFKQVFDDDGNILCTYYRTSSEQPWQILNKNLYDAYGNLTYTKDCVLNQELKLTLDKFGNETEQKETQHNKEVVVSNNYEEDHKNIASTTLSIGEDSLIYGYEYSNNYDSVLNKISLSNGINQTLKYDKLNRIKSIKTNQFSKKFEYLSCGDHTSNLITSETFTLGGISKDCLKYNYDNKGNITEVMQNNSLVARYTYDSLSRLVREDNKSLNKTTTYSYDSGGNIICKTEYNFTLVANLNFETGIEYKYSYSVEGWRDQLKAYNDEKFIYDSLGNPILYRDNVLTWSHGRRLDQFGDITYTYNSNHIRTSKTVNGKKTNFYLNGTQILRQEDGTNTIDFFYGANGILGFSLNGTKYLYKKNIQGDVIGILNDSGVEIGKYVYDAWGNHKIVIQNNVKEVAISEIEEYTKNKQILELNPIRYRSYYYDVETKLYYLNSRYYDPEIGRFINSDDISYLDSSTLNGLNLYAYCGNNPINNIDTSGFGWFKNAWNKVKKFGKKLINNVVSFVKGAVEVISDIVSTGSQIIINSIITNQQDFFFGGLQSGIETSGIFGNFNNPITLYIQKPKEIFNFWEYRLGISFKSRNAAFDFNVGLGGSDIEFSKGNSSIYWKVEAFKTKIGYSISTQGENGIIKNYTEIYLNLVRIAFAYLVITVFKGIPIPIHQDIYNYV